MSEEPQTINYQAYDNMHHASKAWFLLAVPCVGAFIALLVVAILQANQPQYGSSGVSGLAGPVFLTFFVLLIGTVLIYAWRQSKYLDAAFSQFLLDNSFVPETGGMDMVATSLLGIGDSQKVLLAFTGQYQGRTMHGVIYQYKTGNGKSRETHNYANLYFELSQQFPLIVLDSKGPGLAGLFDQLPERIPNGKTLQLEGTFNDTYRVTVLPGTEQQVLQFLTPDFMSELLQVPEHTDIEIEGNKLFIISEVNDGNLYYGFNEPTLQHLFATSNIALKHLNEVAFSWQASSSADTVHQMAATALVPRTKVMLGRRHVGIGGLAGFIVYLLLNAAPSLGSKGLLVVLPVVCAIAVISLVVLWEQHH